MARIPASFLLVTCLLCMVAPIATAEEQPVAPENPPAVAPSPAAQEAPQESPSAPAVPSPDAPSPAPAPEQPQAVVASPEAVPDPSPAASVDPSRAPSPAASPEAVPAQPDADLLLSEEHAAGTGAGKPEGSEPYGAIDDDEFEHVNIAAFQPSHFLTFNLRPASEETFYVDVHKDVELGLPLQGNFFVTNGGDMKVNFEIHAPNSEVVSFQHDASEGFFDFDLQQEGTYTVKFINENTDAPRKITFAWLVGEDADKPVIPKDAAGSTDPTGKLLQSVGRIHRKLDKVISVMAFMDVRLTRNQEIQRNTESRVAFFSVIESVVLAAVTILQVLYIRKLVNSSAQLPGTPGMLGKSGRVYR